MQLKTLTLSYFRTYSKSTFKFSPITIIVGNNAIGKTNILEAIYFLSTGASFRADRDIDTIKTASDFARITGDTAGEDGVKLEVVMAKANNRFSKRFLVNGVQKRLVDFISHLPAVLFTPEDIELLTSSPSARRIHIDRILIQTDKKYRLSLTLYEKALKHRNRLLRDVREEKRIYQEEEFSYWNGLLVEHGEVIHLARANFVEYLNKALKDVFSFHLIYDHSIFNYERVRKYKEIEFKTGMTIIGPQRDEFLYYFDESSYLIRDYCSRGEQRLTILQLKLLEIEYLRENLGEDPLLLLDDVFSELDQDNIKKVIELIPRQQTIITTTHKEFIPTSIEKSATVISLPA